jgi:hypothetical protein
VRTGNFIYPINTGNNEIFPALPEYMMPDAEDSFPQWVLSKEGMMSVVGIDPGFSDTVVLFLKKLSDRSITKNDRPGALCSCRKEPWFRKKSGFSVSENFPKKRSYHEQRIPEKLTNVIELSGKNPATLLVFSKKTPFAIPQLRENSCPS